MLGKKFILYVLLVQLIILFLFQESEVGKQIGFSFDKITLDNVDQIFFIFFTPFICYGGLKAAFHTKRNADSTREMIYENREQAQKEQYKTDMQLQQIKDEFNHRLKSEYDARQLRIYVDVHTSGSCENDEYKLSVDLIHFGGTVCIRDIRTIGGSNKTILLLDDANVDYRQNRIWESKTKRRITFYVPKSYKEAHNLIISYSTQVEPHMEYVFRITPIDSAHASHLLTSGEAQEGSPTIEKDKPLLAQGSREGSSYSINTNPINY